MLKLSILAISLAALTAAGLMEESTSEDAAQPLVFNHKVHMDEDMACGECHLHAEDGVYATLPPTRVCMLCHEEAQGEDPEEPKVREFAEAEDAYIPFPIANELVGHVYFSHEAHVTWAAMDCDECHGDMAEATEPVTVNQVAVLTMETCMDCHEERGASLDCIACHK